MKEVWKKIHGYENYKVSNFGRIKRKKILKPWNLNGRLYLQIALCDKSKYKKFLVHRLVALAFIKNKQNKSQVNHIDNDPSNNNVSNLEWSTPKENTQHAVSQKRNTYGERTNTAKLKASDVIEIRTSTLSVIDLVKKFKVGRMQIYRIKNKTQWKHLE